MDFDIDRNFIHDYIAPVNLTQQIYIRATLFSAKRIAQIAI